MSVMAWIASQPELRTKFDFARTVQERCGAEMWALVALTDDEIRTALSDQQVAYVKILISALVDARWAQRNNLTTILCTLWYLVVGVVSLAGIAIMAIWTCAFALMLTSFSFDIFSDLFGVPIFPRFRLF